ncbi:MAG: CDP-glycerol glycerophosphotransferase family protein [Anaerotruncus sp.]|nr:MAG: CDP-glycerol glycerophosphotransferase family protein [Anaerotruncus sp.]
MLAIKNYIEKNGLDYDITVAAGEDIPPADKLASLMAQSKFILVDDYEPLVYVLRLRENQHLVQVWHAMGAFKRFGYGRASAEKNSLTHKKIIRKR